MENLEEKLDEIMKVLKGVQVQHKDDFERLERNLGTFEKSMDSQFVGQKKITDALIKRMKKTKV